MLLLKKLYCIMNRSERVQSLFLLLLMLVGALTEVVGIGMVLPVIALVSDSTLVVKYPILNSVFQNLGATSHQEFVVLVCIMLVLLFIVKNLFLFSINYFLNRFVAQKQLNMAHDLFYCYLRKPYEFFFQSNTAELQRNLSSSVSMIANGLLINCLNIIAESMVCLAIFVLLIIVDPLSSGMAFLFIGSALLLSYRLSRNLVYKYGKICNQGHAEGLKWLNQGIGCIKEIKVLGRETFFLQRYLESTTSVVDATAKHQVLVGLPRLYFETVAVTAMALVVAVNISRGADAVSLMSVLGVFAMATFRLLPATTRISTLLTNIRFASVALEQIYDDLVEAQNLDSMLLPNSADKLFFEDAIELQQVSYTYPSAAHEVLKKINLTIHKGASIGLVGASGAGKTTLVALILGLLSPTSGSILVDGQNIEDCTSAWQSNIGYIPQDVYLLDDTIARNIAIGISDAELDRERIWKVLEMAQLQEYILGQPEGVDSLVGERGICLSGGQRQRIGIARALYRDPQFLVLDEATSALDNETEKAFMKSIASIAGEKTLFIIAHRETTIQACDSVYRIDKGSIKFVR